MQPVELSAQQSPTRSEHNTTTNLDRKRRQIKHHIHLKNKVPWLILNNILLTLEVRSGLVHGMHYLDLESHHFV